MRLEKVHAQIGRDWDHHLRRVQTFLQQPSVSNEGVGMTEMAELVAATIRKLGGSVQIVPTEGYPVVYGKLDMGAPRTLLLYGMYDVQPAREPDWIVPPFSGELREMNGRGLCIVSRGATNSKGPLAGFLNVLESIQNSGETLPVNILFVIEGEEEMGSRHLPDFIRAHRAELSKAQGAFFPAFRQPLKGEPIMQLGTKGLLYMELTCRGGAWGGPRSRDIHAAYAAWFDNPAWILIQALASMKHGDRVMIEGFYDDVRSPSAADEKLLADLGERYGLDEVLAEHDVARFKYDLPPTDLLREYIFKPTLNIDGIIGGYTEPGSKTLLPHQVTAKMDLRMVPEMGGERMVERIRRHLDTHGFEQVEIEVLGNYPWSKVESANPLVNTFVQSFRQHGFDPLLWPLNPGSAPVYLFYETLGVPYVLCGLGHGERAHSPNELCTVAGLRLFEEWTATFLDLFSSQPGAAA